MKILLIILLCMISLTLFIFIERQMKYNLKINEEINSKFDQQTTWEIILNAFKDSSNVEEWPKNEWIRSNSVAEGNTVKVQYRILGKKYEFEYQIQKLSDYEIGYRPNDDHPLQGDILVSVEKDYDKSKIIWQGDYQTDSLISRLGFNFFTKKFFKELKANLAK